MLKKLYINGDSHTAGTYNSPDNFENCFAGLLARKYNLNYNNHAVKGGSNPRIIRTSKEYLEHENPKETVVLIGWSDSARTEWLIKDKWYQVANHQDYEILENKYLNNVWRRYFESTFNRECDYVMLNRAIEQQYHILKFSKWLRTKGFRHLFLHGNESFFYKRSVFEIEWPDDVWLFNQPYNGTISFCRYCQNKNHQMDSHFHLDMSAHKDYADFIDSEFKKILIDNTSQQKLP